MKKNSRKVVSLFLGVVFILQMLVPVFTNAESEDVKSPESQEKDEEKFSLKWEDDSGEKDLFFSLIKRMDEKEIEESAKKDSRLIFYSPKGIGLSEESEKTMSELGFLYYDEHGEDINPGQNDRKNNNISEEYSSRIYLLPKERKAYIFDLLLKYKNNPEKFDQLKEKAELLKKQNQEVQKESQEDPITLTNEEEKILRVLDTFSIEEINEEKTNQAPYEIGSNEQNGGVQGFSKLLFNNILSFNYQEGSENASASQAESVSEPEKLKSYEIKFKLSLNINEKEANVGAQDPALIVSDEDLRADLIGVPISEENTSKEEDNTSEESLPAKTAEENRFNPLGAGSLDIDKDILLFIEHNDKNGKTLTNTGAKFGLYYYKKVGTNLEETEVKKGLDATTSATFNPESLMAATSQDIKFFIKETTQAQGVEATQEKYEFTIKRKTDPAQAYTIEPASNNNKILDIFLETKKDLNEPQLITLKINDQRFEQDEEPIDGVPNLRINTVNTYGNRLYHTIDPNDPTLRDPNLDHNATYALYKKGDDGVYHPVNIYPNKAYDPGNPSSGQPEMVNWKHGDKGIIDFSNLEKGDYLVKEVKSVFQFAFKNIAFTFNVDDQNKINSLKEVRVDKADYENPELTQDGLRNGGSWDTVNGKYPLTYTDKMIKDSQRLIDASEIHDRDQDADLPKLLDQEHDITDGTGKVLGKEINATYYQGNLTVKKTDEQGKPLEGAIFELHGHDERRLLRIYRVRTDANGIARFENLNVPSYHLLKEVEAPEGYALPDKQWMTHFGEGTWISFEKGKPAVEHIPLQIADNNVYMVECNRRPVVTLNAQGTTQEKKNDKYRPLIDGVTKASVAVKNWFQYTGLKDPDPALVEGTPADQSFWEANWTNTDYVGSGKTALVNYKDNFNQTKQERFYSKIEMLKPEKDSQAGVFTVVDQPRAKIEILKTDDNGENLAGATFGLYEANNDGSLKLVDGKPVPVKKALTPWTVMSAKDGSATFDNVPAGKYVLMENSAPGGYQKDSSQYRITVNQDGTINSINTGYGLGQTTRTGAGVIDYHVNFYENGFWGDAISLSKTIKYDSWFYSRNIQDGSFVQALVLKPEKYSGDSANLSVDGFERLDKSGFNIKISQLPSAVTGISGYSLFNVDDASSLNFDANGALISKDLSQVQMTKIGDYSSQDALSQALTSLKGKAAVIFINGTYDPNSGSGLKTKLTYKTNQNGYFDQSDVFYPYSGADSSSFSSTDFSADLSQNENDHNSTQENGTNVLPLTIVNRRDFQKPTDEKGMIKLRKTESNLGGKLLGGARFSLYKGLYGDLTPDDQPILVKESLDDEIKNDPKYKMSIGPGATNDYYPNLIMEQLPVGTYTLKEESAPLGYYKTNNSWTINVYPSGLTVATLNPKFDEDSTTSHRPVLVNDRLDLVPNSFTFGVAPKGEYVDPGRDFMLNASDFFKATFKLKTNGNLSNNKIYRGDYFTINYDERLNLKGTYAVSDLPKIIYNNRVIAVGEDDEVNHQIKYTFTDAIEEGYNSVEIEFLLYPSINRYKWTSASEKNQKMTFKWDLTDEKVTTDEQTINPLVLINDPPGNTGTFWNYGVTHKVTSFINPVNNAERHVEDLFYIAPVNTYKPYVTGGWLKLQIPKDNNETAYESTEGVGYEVYEVTSDQFVTSFGVDFSKLGQPVLKGKLTGDEGGNFVALSKDLATSNLIVRYKVPFSHKNTEVYVRPTLITNYTINSYNYQATATMKSYVVIKEHKVIGQTELNQAEVYAYNKLVDPMEIDLIKQDKDGNVIKHGPLELSILPDTSSSKPGPQVPGLENITISEDRLKAQNKDLKNFITIEIPKEVDLDENGQQIRKPVDGDYIISETKAPAGTVLNGLKYYITVDAQKRTIQLTRVTKMGANGQEVDAEYKYRKGAGEVPLKKGEPVTIYEEVADPDNPHNKVKLGMLIVNPKASYPFVGGKGPKAIICTGIALMSSALLMQRRKARKKSGVGKKRRVG